MLLKSDAKVLIMAYRWIEKNCNLIDEFVYKHSINFGPSPEYCSTYDVTNNIIDLIERKNRLINLKLILDELIDELSVEDKKILLAKMKFNLSMKLICEAFKMPSLRTAFRRIDKAIQSFTIHANNSQYKAKLEYMLDKEYWTANIRKNMEEKNVCG